MSQRYTDFLQQARDRVREIMPWDLQTLLSSSNPPLLLDVREAAEFGQAHVVGAVNVPRGVLEQACEWDSDETEPLLIQARTRPVVVICRSGNRSLLAADVLQTMGYTDVVSLKTGMRGWVDFEQAVVDGDGTPIDTDEAEQRLAAKLRPNQRQPKP